MFPVSVPAHHAETADPVLLEWIKHQLDALIGAGPLPIVLVLGLVIVAVPALIMGIYLVQRPHQR